MMKKLICILLFFGSLSCWAQFLDGKKNLQKFEGFFDFHYSETTGEIYLEVDNLDTEFLYVHSLSFKRPTDADSLRRPANLISDCQ